ncbi:hypothetical protein SAMN04487936_110146 [Halobacillus dabanensis]|uniref:YneQ n=1 Tax=Halobacillus dabanensis TaxID=240302 RepID=A0A1I3YDT9_HALDA|nr:hypothetical protein [Halobacillus dabanensis]SFK29346.1 hypothetical protein SAMN04487936_110146 [Halobacillus dabanensis]
MAFGVKKEELRTWKTNVRKGNIAILTHFWLDERFPGCDTVTKVGCSNIDKLKEWGRSYGLAPEWIHRDPHYPHFDLFGDRQLQILKEEGCWNQIHRFRLEKK